MALGFLLNQREIQNKFDLVFNVIWSLLFPKYLKVTVQGVDIQNLFRKQNSQLISPPCFQTC